MNDSPVFSSLFSIHEDVFECLSHVSCDVYVHANCGLLVTGRFCGVGKLPATLVSSESRMWIQYRTSGRTTHRGFSAKYEGKEPPSMFTFVIPHSTLLFLMLTFSLQEMYISLHMHLTFHIASVKEIVLTVCGSVTLSLTHACCMC